VGDELNLNLLAYLARKRERSARGRNRGRKYNRVVGGVGAAGRADGYGHRQRTFVRDAEMLGLGEFALVDIDAVAQRLGRYRKFTYGRLGLVWRRSLIRLRQRWARKRGNQQQQRKTKAAD